MLLLKLLLEAAEHYLVSHPAKQFANSSTLKSAPTDSAPKLPDMGYMHHLDWLFAIGVLFFLLSAWSIGK